MPDPIKEAKALEDSALSLAEKGCISEAIQKFEKAIELAPEDGAIRYNFGITCMKNSMIEKAIEQMTFSTLYKPNHVDTYFALASLFTAKGIDAKAALYYLGLLEFGRNDQQTVITKARLHELDKEALNFPLKAYLDIAKKNFEVIQSKALQDTNANSLPTDLKAKAQAYFSHVFRETRAIPHFRIVGEFS